MLKTKKRYLISLAAVAVLTVLGVKNPERVVAVVNDGYSELEGHSPE